MHKHAYNVKSSTGCVVDAGGGVPRHVHPGIEMAYVIEGPATLALAGQPERGLGAGDSFAIPDNAVHSVRNAGPAPLTTVSTYVVAKDRPVMIPQP